MENNTKMSGMSLLEIKAMLDFALFQMTEQSVKGNDSGLQYWSQIYYKCRRRLVEMVEEIEF